MEIVPQSDPLNAYRTLAQAMLAVLDGDSERAILLMQEARAQAGEDAEAVRLLSIGVISEFGTLAKTRKPRPTPPHNEYATVQFWFKKSGVLKIPGAELIPLERKAGYAPDFMVVVQGDRRPVECKKTFDARALNQLTSYLEAYGATQGYAVAFRLTCKLPDNITFIECPPEAAHV